MPTPVFVYGALRSGTTLFRLMLNCHSRVGNPGEVDFLFDYLQPDLERPDGWRYDMNALRTNRIVQAHALDLDRGLDGIDLLHDLLAQFRARSGGVLTANVHRHAERILQVLPEARFIHLVRDPRDVARSSTGMGWAGLSYYGVDHWIETERGWDGIDKVLEPGQAIELRFEQLMSNLKGELGRICAFLGVPFEAAMLNYHLDTTYGPPDPSIAHQWKRKASAREIALIEGKCDGLLAARGYTGQDEPVFPGTAKKLALFWHNRLLRWQGKIGRVGLLLFLSEKLSRRLGLRRTHARIQNQIDAKTVEMLK